MITARSSSARRIRAFERIVRVIAICSIIVFTGNRAHAGPDHAAPDSGPKVAVSALAEIPLWTEDFEGNWFLDWTVEAGTWEVGVPTSGPGAAFAGLNVAATVLAGNYAANVDSRLIRTTTFVVPAASESPRLRFWHWFSFSSGDDGEVQISTDGGATWQTISDSYTDTGSGVWSRPSLDLSAFAGSTAQIAFDFSSDASGTTVSSGWYLDEVVVATGTPTFPDPEGFETGLGDWAVQQGTWEVGDATTGPASCFFGTGCAATVLGGNYAPNIDSRMVSAPFTVPGASASPRLRFWHWFSFSSGDDGEVQISTDGGTTWQTISNSFGNTSSGVWTRPSLDLSAFADLSAQIAFDFSSDASGTTVSSGWYVDDVTVVTGTPAFPNPEGFEGGLGDWAAEEGTWEVGVATVGPGTCRTGSVCGATVLSGNYAPNIDSRLISAPFTVPPAGDDPTLLVWHWFSFSSGDDGEVQISTDQGASWTTILGPYVNTSSGVWSPISTSIAAFADQTAQIAFDFGSDASGTTVSTGWYIDDITIFCGAEACVLPVELISWEARVIDNDVLLEWTTASEVNNAGFDVEHRALSGEFIPAGFVEGAGNSRENQDYAFRLNNLAPGAHAFRLKQMDFDGSVDYSDVVEVNIGVSDTYTLSEIYPNPLSHTASFTLAVAADETVTVELFDLLGRRHSILLEGALARNQQVDLDIDASNLQNGLYFVRVIGERFATARSVVVMK